jgi:hypothetical protein
MRYALLVIASDAHAGPYMELLYPDSKGSPVWVTVLIVVGMYFYYRRK